LPHPPMGSRITVTDAMVCGSCGEAGHFTAPVAVILLFAPGLPKPYPLIPDGDYRVCGACDAPFKFVTLAADAHPLCRDAGPWTRAVIVGQDGEGMEIRAHRQAMATA
jgi:hypothetical protein